MIHLSPREREVVVLIGFLRYPYKRAAKEMGCAPATVRVHANRVKMKTGYNLPPRDALTRLYWCEISERKDEV
ncbi:MAG: sigma-70 region 4 domain-containing protein [Anaerolineales bacterium]|nr:sigma-70 region 4 domain-containing protein [Anaerolineales bacterium]